MNTRIQTPQMSRVRDLADQALNTSDGLGVLFLVSDYGSLKAAHAGAKGLQSAFSALRARTRRAAMRINSEPEYVRDVKSVGPYDTLACVLTWLPEERGCQIKLMPGSLYGVDFKVIDLATGEDFEPEDPSLNRMAHLNAKRIHAEMEAKRNHRDFYEPLSEDELQWAWKNRPDLAQEWNFSRSQQMLDADQPDRPESDYASVDLADLDESELEIVNPEPGE